MEFPSALSLETRAPTEQHFSIGSVCVSAVGIAPCSDAPSRQHLGLAIWAWLPAVSRNRPVLDQRFNAVSRILVRTQRQGDSNLLPSAWR